MKRLANMDDLPKAKHTETLNVGGYELTACVLDDGRRIYQDTPELRRMLKDIGGEALLPPPETE